MNLLNFLLTALLVSLPVFGNRPAMPQTIALLFISIVLLTLIYVHKLIFKVKTLKINFANPIIFFTSSYLIVSILSLSTYLSSNFFSKLFQRFENKTPATFCKVIYRILKSSEASVFYPVLSVLFTIVAALIALEIYKLCCQSKKNIFLFLSSILAGWFIAAFIGLADYFNFTDLRFLRELDPVVNPNNIQMRLQSFFGHSGWYAEYVTLVVPLVLLFFLLPISFFKRILITILSLLLGELILILTYQRGGWLSYPLTLVVVWFSIYAFYKLEKGEKNLKQALKSSVLKVLISLPLTVLLSAGLVMLLQKYNIINKERFLTADRYLERVKEIGQVSDRSTFFKAGFLLGSLHPFYGAGSESFAVQFEKEFEKPKGKFYQRYSLPLHGSAHNVYMQTFAGKGVAGLISLLAIMFSLIYFPIKIIFQNQKLDLQPALLFFVAISFSAAFLIYGNVQEVFYIQSLQILFFAIIACLAPIFDQFKLSSKFRTKYSLLFVTLFLVHLFWEL